MNLLTKLFLTLSTLSTLGLTGCLLRTLESSAQFHVITFYNGKTVQAHISFVGEANRWFSEMATQHHFTYRATTNWNELNPETLPDHQVVVFLDTRPESSTQRTAFERYMEHGGAWLGFHFADLTVNGGCLGLRSGLRPPLVSMAS